MQFGRLFDPGMTKAQRAWLRVVLRDLRGQGVERAEIPNAGALEAVHLAVEAGFKPSQLTATSLSLPTVAALSYASGKTAREVSYTLGVKFPADMVVFDALLDGPNAWGALFLAIHIAQLRTERMIEARTRRAMIAEAGRYAEATQAGLWEALDVLRGVNGRIGDVWTHANLARGDSAAVLILDMPRSRDAVSAADRRAAEVLGTVGALTPSRVFTPKTDSQALADTVFTGNAWGLVAATPAIADRWSDKVVFAAQHKANDIDYVLSSRPLSASFVARRETKVVPPMWPLFDDDCIITESSSVQFVETSRGVALYLRDLWAHKLGVTRSESYYLMLVDGRVTSTFGLFFSFLTTNKLPIVTETFGFSVGVGRYQRINKLLMTCLTSGEAKRYFMAQRQAQSSLLELETFQTTCISIYPEVKTHRGMSKLVHRHQRPDGRYHLKYEAPFNNLSFHDAPLKWIQRDSKFRGRNYVDKAA